MVKRRQIECAIKAHSASDSAVNLSCYLPYLITFESYVRQNPLLNKNIKISKSVFLNALQEFLHLSPITHALVYFVLFSSYWRDYSWTLLSSCINASCCHALGSDCKSLYIIT